MVLRGDWLNTLCLMARLGQPVKETGSNQTMEGETPGEQGRTSSRAGQSTGWRGGIPQ